MAVFGAAPPKEVIDRAVECTDCPATLQLLAHQRPHAVLPVAIKLASSDCWSQALQVLDQAAFVRTSDVPPRETEVLRIACLQRSPYHEAAQLLADASGNNGKCPALEEQVSHSAVLTAMLRSVIGQ